jgi:cell division protein FtsB
MRNKLLTGVFAIVGLYLIVSFSRDLVVFWGKGKEFEKSQAKLDQTAGENEELKKQLGYVKSTEFVEKEAREKLGMAKEGETTLILPENLNQVIESREKETKQEQVPNWKKWAQFFSLLK